MKLKVKKTFETMTKLFSPTPKFQGWVKEDYERAGIPAIDVMTCKEYDPKYLKKHSKGTWIAQDKLDGHRAICICTADGFRFFSRRISKVTGWYAENSDCVPHLRDAKRFVPIGTIFDGELDFDFEGTTSKDVQSVTGALPAKAIAFQEEHGFLVYKIFDILSLGLASMEEDHLLSRMEFLKDCFSHAFPPYFQQVKTYRQNSSMEYGEGFQKLLEQLWDEGKEGLVLKNTMSIYMQGKRSTEWLKRKETKTVDCIITGFSAPTKIYEGKEMSKWKYWEDTQSGCFLVDTPHLPLVNRYVVPVTKPYYMGWCGAVEFGLLKDGEVVKIGEASGITDSDREYIKAHAEELIGTTVEIECKGIVNKETNSLRHPQFKQFRPDKNAEDCLWEGFGE